MLNREPGVLDAGTGGADVHISARAGTDRKSGWHFDP
jgi:hypothetical protein